MSSAARFGLLALLVLTPLAMAPGHAAGQGEVSLERVEELTRLGRTEEAREALASWWDGSRDSASRRDRQRALWLRGRLTVDPAQAELDYRRLVIEYPGGPFSDQALLRLAQSGWARGDVEAAERHLDQLFRDYPGSPVGREARAWRTEAGAAPQATGTVEVAEERVGPRVAEEAPVADESAPPAVPEISEPGGRQGRGDDARPDPAASVDVERAFAVQLGAFAGEGRARVLRDRIAGAGYEARLVRVEGSRLLHVRVGRFADMADAEALLDDLRSLGLTAALVRDAHREEGVSR